MMVGLLGGIYYTTLDTELCRAIRQLDTNRIEFILSGIQHDYVKIAQQRCNNGERPIELAMTEMNGLNLYVTLKRLMLSGVDLNDINTTKYNFDKKYIHKELVREYMEY